MSNPQRPPFPTQATSDSHPYGDPFSDRTPHIQFQEPEMPPRPFESTTTLPTDLGEQSVNYPENEDYEEKLPLTGNQGFVGGLYPPGCVVDRAFSKACIFAHVAETVVTVANLILMNMVTPMHVPRRSCRHPRTIPIHNGAADRPLNVVSLVKSS